MTDRGKTSKTAPEASPADGERTRVLLVTGMSGAGKTAALKALEDMGYEAVDNLPLSMLAALVQPGSGHGRPLAIGVDIRTRDFGIAPVIEEVERLIAGEAVDVRLLFLECDDEVLRRRYTETRRRHPLAADRPVMDGIRHERQSVLPLRDRADTVIDTTELQLSDFQRMLKGHFDLDRGGDLAIFVTSFSFRRGLPREADLVLDVRFLANPHYEPALRDLTGQDQDVASFVQRDADFGPFSDSLKTMLKPLLPRYRLEGKSYLTIAVGCTGGRHRSVFVAESLASWLREQGAEVSLAHRDLPQ